MKARVLVLICILIIVSFTSCSRANDSKETDTTETTETTQTRTVENTLETTKTPNTSEQKDLWKIDWDTFEKLMDSSHEGPPLLRLRYYDISRSFAEIVGRKECEEWEDRYYKSTLHIGPDVVNEMFMVSFIKEFNVTREQFDKANESFIEFLVERYNQNTEEGEIYNADLIYTFNNEKINDYYGRDLKKAKAADEWLQKWLKTNKPYNSYSEYQQSNAD